MSVVDPFEKPHEHVVFWRSIHEGQKGSRSGVQLARSLARPLLLLEEATATCCTCGLGQFSSKAASSTSYRERLATLEKRARAAVAADGHPNGQEIADQISGCVLRGRAEAVCLKLAEDLERESSAAVFAGMAIAALHANVDLAERMVERAEEAAAEDGPRRRAVVTQVKDDDATVKGWLVSCEEQRQLCVDRCREGMTAACVADGFLTWKQDGKLDDARRAFSQACEAGFPPGCKMLKAVDLAKREEAKKVEDAWAAVVAAGDDLAQKKFMLNFAKKNLTGRRNALAAQRMTQHISALEKEAYCPAVQAFLAVSTRTEFAKRARMHCDSEPPVTTGLSGNEVELTVECRAVYAKPCT